MEADILRLILFLVGAALVFGIYLADRYKKKEPDKPISKIMQMPKPKEALKQRKAIM